MSKPTPEEMLTALRTIRRSVGHSDPDLGIVAARIGVYLRSRAGSDGRLHLLYETCLAGGYLPQASSAPACSCGQPAISGGYCGNCWDGGGGPSGSIGGMPG
jgi:hypothetical protein